MKERGSEMKVEYSQNNENHIIEHAYQPIWKLDNWKLYGYEALLRFSDGYCQGNIEAAFEKVRDEGDLYELDIMSISKAVSHFPFQHYYSERLFVNIFPSTLLNEKFESFITQLLIEHPQAKGKVVIELNESREEEQIWMIPKLKEKITFLKSQNFYIALDDVGKGVATLQKIIEFSPDYIKLDRYFARELYRSKEKQKMVTLLVEYTRSGMTLILEGIEQEIDLAKAKSLNVPIAQGFLLGRPQKLTKQNYYNVFRY